MCVSDSIFGKTQFNSNANRVLAFTKSNSVKIFWYASINGVKTAISRVNSCKMRYISFRSSSRSISISLFNWILTCGSINVKLPVLLEPKTVPGIFRLCEETIVKTLRSLIKASFVSPNTFSFSNLRTSLSKLRFIWLRIVFIF